jgi:hypothetical protein
MTMLWIGVALSTLAVCLVLARHRYDARVREWRSLCNPQVRRHLAQTEELCRAERDCVESAYRSARAQTDGAEAARLLRAAYEYIAGVQADRLTRLRAMIVMMRMAMAILPAPPVSWRRFGQGRMRAIALVLGLLHYVLVSPMERFALRVRILILGFGLTLRAMARSTKRVHRIPADGAAWDAFGRGVEDWKTLDIEHLAAAVHLAESLSAVRRPAPQPAQKQA